MTTKALLVGATGLVGSEIIHYALNDARIEKLIVFTRRSTGLSHPKLVEHVVDFEQLASWRHLLSGDVLFSTLGTTKKQVGTREAQRIVDFDYQLRVAQSARLNGVSNLVLVSAPHADPKSRFAYTQMKGELERAVQKLSFSKLTIVRPGLLKGRRTAKRPVEQAAARVLNLFPVIPGLEAMKPVSGKLVAHACIESAFRETQGQRILNPKDVLQFLK